MDTKRNKVLHYKRVVFSEENFETTYEELVTSAFMQLKTIGQRTVTYGDEKKIKCLKYKKAKNGGIFVHLSTYVEGELASTIANNPNAEESDLDTTQAPAGSDFVDGDIHALILGNDILFCLSTARDSTIKNYFDLVFEKIGVDICSHAIKPPISKQIISMLESGVKTICLDSLATPLEMKKLIKSKSRLLKPLKTIAELIFSREQSLEEVQGLDGLMFGLHVNSKGRIDAESQSQVVMQSMGREIIEEELNGFYIITRDGSKITANSISHKHKIRLDKFGKTVFRNETWAALSLFREKLEEQRIITRKQ